jgi:protoporphyrinogen oxidase
MTGMRIAIVGGGLIGLYLASRLCKRGADVTLFEAAAETGGLAAPAAVGAYRWDRFYHVILLSDLNTLDLLDELGLRDRLRWGVTRTGFYTDGRLYSLSDSLEFLRFPPLSLVDKARLASTIMLASRIKDWQALEKVPVVDWLRRWSGDRVTEKIWLPLLKSKLGENYRIASAAFIWAIIARMYAARRAGLKREMFGYVDGGYELVLRKLRTRLEELGVRILTGARVSDVRQAADDVMVRVEQTSHVFDQAILTLPAPQILHVCPQLAPEERRRLENITYQGIVCASLLLKKPLGGFYVTNITDRWVPFTGVIEMTALVDRERFGGSSLVYLPRYLAQNEAFWSLGDDEIREQFLAAIERMYPTFRRDDVLAFHLSRARHVLALSTIDYSQQALPAVATSLPGIAIVNSAQIANGTLNVNETLAVAKAGLAALEPRLHQLGMMSMGSNERG